MITMEGIKKNGDYLLEWFFCPANEYGPDMSYYRIYSCLSNKNILEVFVKDDINGTIPKFSNPKNMHGS